MPRNLVLNDGVLAEKIVTESHQPIELAQLEAEVASHEATVTSLTEQIDALNKQKTDAEAALEDSKSDLQTGQGLVAQPAESGPENGAEAGTDEQTTDSVAIPVTAF